MIDQDNNYFSGGGIDEKVKQTPTDIINETYEILFSGSADNEERTEGARKSQYATFNPSKKAFTFGIRKSGLRVGTYSYAEGINTTASGTYSHAEGGDTTASGATSHVEGYNTTGSNFCSHAEGGGTTASGDYSHAEGGSTTASGNSSHAEGRSTTASGDCSHTEGHGTIANHKSQHVFGEYNITDPSTTASDARGNYAEIVGNGTGSDERSNARTLDWSGNEVLTGTLTTTDVINSTTWDGTNSSLRSIIVDLQSRIAALESTLTMITSAEIDEICQ